MYHYKKLNYEAGAEHRNQKWTDREDYIKCIYTLCDIFAAALQMLPEHNKKIFDKPDRNDPYFHAKWMLIGCEWPVFVRAHKKFYRVAAGKEQRGTPDRVRELALKMKAHIGYEKTEPRRVYGAPQPAELSGRFYVNGGKITIDISPEILAAMAQNH